MDFMDILLIIVVSALTAAIVVIIAALIVWRMLSQRTRGLARRVGALPWDGKWQLALRLMRDERIPPLLRLIPPVLVIYLALPIDLIPDFVPILGQIDDILVLAVGLALLVRAAPMRIFDEHLSDLEPIDAEVRDVTDEPPALPPPRQSPPIGNQRH
jgi:uncharacterized membrane protein YkvA (DUF1232 family)